MKGAIIAPTAPVTVIPSETPSREPASSASIALKYTPKE